MSDEKRREELKTKINEQLDKLSIEDLESVAGGAIMAHTCKNCGAQWYTLSDMPIGDDYTCPKCGFKN